MYVVKVPATNSAFAHHREKGKFMTSANVRLYRPKLPLARLSTIGLR